MIKSFRILFSSLAVLLILLSCSLPVMATDYGDGDPDSDIYPDDLPMLFIESGITIISQPQSVTAVLGDTVTFSVVAQGEDLTYQWYWWKAEVNGWSTTSVPGNKTDTITVEATSVRNGYRYRCTISNSLGYVISDAVTLTVVDPPETEPPVIDPPEVDNSFTIGEILELFDTGAAAVVSWFSSIMDSTGAGTVYIAMMSVVLSVAILLGPLLGSARSGLSDVVHRPRQKEDNK